MAVPLGLGLEREILSLFQLFQSPLNGGKQVQFGIFPPIPMKTYPVLEVLSPYLRCSEGCGEGAVNPVSAPMGWINVSVGRLEWL